MERTHTHYGEVKRGTTTTTGEGWWVEVVVNVVSPIMAYEYIGFVTGRRGRRRKPEPTARQTENRKMGSIVIEQNSPHSYTHTHTAYYGILVWPFNYQDTNVCTNDDTYFRLYIA